MVPIGVDVHKRRCKVVGLKVEDGKVEVWTPIKNTRENWLELLPRRLGRSRPTVRASRQKDHPPQAACHLERERWSPLRLGVVAEPTDTVRSHGAHSQTLQILGNTAPARSRQVSLPPRKSATRISSVFLHTLRYYFQLCQPPTQISALDGVRRQTERLPVGLGGLSGTAQAPQDVRSRGVVKMV
jgi:hypothetical protein